MICDRPLGNILKSLASYFKANKGFQSGYCSGTLMADITIIVFLVFSVFNATTPAQRRHAWCNNVTAREG